MEEESNTTSAVNVPVDSDFIFFPKKNAKWIVKSDWITKPGTFNFIDTFYVGVDTLYHL